MSIGNNPWIPIADLLSGFVIVLLLLFVTASLLPHFERQVAVDAARAERERREAERAEFLRSLESRLRPFADRGTVRMDVSRRLIEFGDVSFASGSACLTDGAESAVRAIAPVVAGQFATDPLLVIQVEGHTDPSPVRRLSNSCGWFANNTQLSTLRAQNVRELLVSGSADARARMPVTGWGPDRLRNREVPDAPENRRIELHIVWSDNAATAGGT